MIPLILLLAALGYIAYAAKYNFGSLTNPGVGFFPTLMGIALAVCAGGLLLPQSLRVREKPDSESTEVEGQELIWAGKAFAFLAALLAFALLHSVLGFWVSIFGTMVALLRISGVSRWTGALAGGVITAALSYLVFEYWLRVLFPEGFLR